MKIEVPTDTPTEFKLGDAAADIQRRREEREQRKVEEGEKQQREGGNSSHRQRSQWPKTE